MPDRYQMSWEQAVEWLRSQSDCQELIKNCFYDDPLEQSAQRYFESAEWKAVRRLLPPATGTALDIGAGRGISSFALASDGWRVTALEPDSSNVVGSGAIRQLAHRCALPITVAETWGEALPFPDASFDVVHCRQVLHHARDMNALCSEVSRVLKPGGRFIATREHVISKPSDLPIFLANHPLHHLYGGENAFHLSVYKSAIRSSGMKLDRVFNPYASDINLYPKSRMDLKRQLANLLHLPVAGLIPDILLRLIGSGVNTPGRLYTFVGRKVVGGL